MKHKTRKKLKKKKFNIESNLFADDLASSCSSSNLNIIEKELNNHLKNLEKWLKMWRLNMSSSKCQYIIFSKDPKASKFEIKLKLFDGLIPKTDCIKFLGINLNYNMSLNECVEELRNKCNKRLNIIKILSHKSWKLTQKSLITIYYALVRSIIDYASTIFPLLSDTNKKSISSIQYHALRFIMKMPIKTSHTLLLNLTNVSTIEERINQLNTRYIEKAFLNENELIIDICKSYLARYPYSRIPKYRTLLCDYRELIRQYVNESF